MKVCDSNFLRCLFQGYGSRNGQALRIDHLEKVRECLCLLLYYAEVESLTSVEFLGGLKYMGPSCLFFACNASNLYITGGCRILKKKKKRSSNH